MGLGLFIAKTLLERSGAELTFANGRDPYTGETHDAERSGAIVEAVWPRADIVAEQAEAGRPLGENIPIQA
jgi:two-component system sensor histidine kinase RegB